MKKRNKKQKLTIMGVTKDSEAYEKEIISYLISEFAKHDSKMELIDISTYEEKRDYLRDALDIAEKSNKKVILLTDAEIGNTDSYQAVVKMIYDRRIRPFVLVTHFESAKYDLFDVARGVHSLLEYYDDRYDWFLHHYDYLFFDGRAKRFYEIEMKEGRDERGNFWEYVDIPRDIGFFINMMEEYCLDSDWSSGEDQKKH